jgi:hypothetical protein
MSDDNNKDMESDKEIPVKKGSRKKQVKKGSRKKQASRPDNTEEIPTEKIPTEKIPMENTPMENTPMEETAIEEMLSQLIAGSVHKYSHDTNKQFQDAREDYNCLQPILTEFLDDFLIIGHTPVGQRLVMRHAESPVQLDALTELSKKVLVRMLMQEQSGD